MRMTQYFIVCFPFFFFDGKQRISIVFEGNKLVLIELLLLHIVECHYVFVLEMFCHMLPEIRIC